MSCKIVKGLTYMHKKNPKVSMLQVQDKSIKFIPMVHFGKKEYYDHSKAIIENLKQEGYVVYYEQIKSRFEKMNTAKDTYDTLLWKYRKMSGGFHSREEYTNDLGGVFKNMRAQPFYDSLGITATDINADVNIEQLVTQYEKLYGAISIDSCDINTPIGSEYNCGNLKNNMKPLFDDFRNENLATTIKNSKDKKIVVVYGANHIKPIKRLLQQQK